MISKKNLFLEQEDSSEDEIKFSKEFKRLSSELSSEPSPLSEVDQKLRSLSMPFPQSFAPRVEPLRSLIKPTPISLGKPSLPIAKLTLSKHKQSLSFDENLSSDLESDDESEILPQKVSQEEGTLIFFRQSLKRENPSFSRKKSKEAEDALEISETFDDDLEEEVNYTSFKKGESVNKCLSTRKGFTILNILETEFDKVDEI